MKIFKAADKKPAIHSERAFKGGTYSFGITVLVLAILVTVNILAGVLPVTLTKQDISASQLYSVTSNTKVVVNALTEDVTIYWIVQNDMEDEVIENLLAKYESLSDHISVVKKNPDTYPTFAQQYTSGQVYNNSLIVECGEKYRYISYSDIYLSDVDYTTYSQVYSFDGEGAITSAIDYVVSDDLPQIYALEGHGEEDLPEEVSSQISRDNMEIVSFSLLNEDQIPEDADCILIYAPESDISEEERGLLAAYAAEGGKLLVMAGPVEEGTLTNLYGLLEEYGITAAEGIVVEEDRSHYAFQAPYVLLPDLQSHTVTDSLITEKYHVILPMAAGLTISGTEKGTVSALLTTSEYAFSKTAGYSLETYEKEEGDIDGPFALAVSVENDKGGSIVWISSSAFLDEMFNAYSSGANVDFVINALSSLIGESEAIAIRSKSLSYNYLTISETTAAILKTLIIGVIPAVFVIGGIAVTLERRKRRNAQS